MFLLFGISFSVIFAQTKINIAISDLTGQGIDQTSVQIISDRLRSEVFKTGACTVLERETMQQILREQGFQQSGCTSDQCMVEIGQLLGVTHMVAGIVGKIGIMYTISVRMIDIKTGKIVYSDNIDCKCQIEDVLTGSVATIARKIANSISPVAIPASVPPPVLRTGFLTVDSKPGGATVSLNDSARGVTPYRSGKMATGEYRLKLDMSGFRPVEEKIEIVTNKTVTMKYKLALLKKAALPYNEKPGAKHRLWPKLAFGLAAAGAAVAGVAFDDMVKKNVDRKSVV
jgi:TolB-like protein